jgi:hypothetical protein
MLAPHHAFGRPAAGIEISQQAVDAAALASSDSVMGAWITLNSLAAAGQEMRGLAIRTG